MKSKSKYIKRSIKDPKTGKRVYFYGKSEREVQRKIFDFEERAEKGRTFREVADEWWNIEVANLSPSTIAGYQRATARTIEHFGERYISEITTADISRWLNLLKLKQYAKKTIKNHKIIVNRIFHFAVVMGDLTFNAAKEVELPRGLKESKRRPATPAEEKVIKGTADKWLLPTFALYTGLRKGELLGLQWRDIDLEDGVIFVRRSVWWETAGERGIRIKLPKTDAGIRIVPILAPLREILAAKGQHCPNHYVFGGERPLTPKEYTYRYNKYKKTNGITATVQQLRKSFATLAVSADVPPDVLKTIIGHRDISTTLNIYAEVRAERVKEAAELMNNSIDKD